MPRTRPSRPNPRPITRPNRRPAPILLVLIVGALVGACGSATPSSPALSATVAPPTQSTAGPLPAGPTATPAATCAAATLDAMTEDQRVGQLFALGIDHDQLSEAETAAIETYHLGSAFLVNPRTGGLAGVRPVTSAIQALATDSVTHRVLFFIGADQEGGEIQRITGPGFSTIPSAVEQGQLPPAVLETDAESWGRELAAAGVNLDLAPVMDVVPSGADASNAPIGALDREFGHDPTTVGDHGAAVVRGMRAAGVATTLKHFPGLGRVTGNTDTAAGVVDSATTPDDPYLASFRAGIEAGAPMVMVSLATYTAIDPAHRAVFSPAVIGGMLRETLGFDGVVVSDDLGAATAVASMSPADRAVGFIAAGGDLVLVEGTAPAAQMAGAVAARAATDAAFRAQVDAAAARVLEAKSAFGLLSCRS